MRSLYERSSLKYEGILLRVYIVYAYICKVATHFISSIAVLISDVQGVLMTITARRKCPDIVLA